MPDWVVPKTFEPLSRASRRSRAGMLDPTSPAFIVRGVRSDHQDRIASTVALDEARARWADPFGRQLVEHPKRRDAT